MAAVRGGSTWEGRIERERDVGERAHRMRTEMDRDGTFAAPCQLLGGARWFFSFYQLPTTSSPRPHPLFRSPDCSKTNVTRSCRTCAYEADVAAMACLGVHAKTLGTAARRERRRTVAGQGNRRGRCKRGEGLERGAKKDSRTRRSKPKRSSADGTRERLCLENSKCARANKALGAQGRSRRERRREPRGRGKGRETEGTTEGDRAKRPAPVRGARGRASRSGGKPQVRGKRGRDLSGG